MVTDLIEFLKKISLNLYSIGILSKKDEVCFTELFGSYPTIANVLCWRPINYKKYSKVQKNDNILIGSMVALPVTIVGHDSNAKFAPRRFSKKKVYQIKSVTDDGFIIDLVFFKIFESQISRFAIGSSHFIKGKIEAGGSGYKIIHPTIVKNDNDKKIDERLDENPQSNVIESVYKMSSELTQLKIKSTVKKCLDYFKLINLPDWSNRHEISFFNAIQRIHIPNGINDTDPQSELIKRLSYDELLAFQISIRIARSKKYRTGKKIIGDGSILRKIKLPFGLTKSQLKVIDEIKQDQTSERKMFRLLQGDVGSGKTIVSIISALNTIESGLHVAIMVPTTILAKQYFKVASELIFGSGVNVSLLTSGTKKSERQKIISELKNNNIDLLIGTHSLISEDVEMGNFGLFIIDEQHRFGVRQRIDIFNKSKDADILMMTATPIPRTLSMSMYGDIDVSVISEKPHNRKKIDTRIMSISKYEEMIVSFKKAISNGEKVYWVCPLIEENEDEDIIATEQRFDEFISFFGSDNVGMIHGKMKEAERELVMRDFISGRKKIIVCTTVIEVGVDVPDATVIVIERADRFGLAQLHQLRGRVGRGDKQSYCILLYNDSTTRSGIDRLKIIKENDDGFMIAEQDLKLRGSGNILGLKQSGFGDFKFANLSTDFDILKQASVDADRLTPKQGEELSDSIRFLLTFFGHDNIIKLIHG